MLSSPAGRSTHKVACALLADSREFALVTTAVAAVVICPGPAVFAAREENEVASRSFKNDSCINWPFLSSIDDAPCFVQTGDSFYFEREVLRSSEIAARSLRSEREFCLSAD
ncbi:hypothetical protein B0T10DRAFT_462755 [Thelonectria olida]|uniref:Uncharacterized protein n=1 Tax=Thelonectria olida TaxID=1576542 RepID=A0A9P9ALB2_9HYPO|nr:hypothetical protein B0T10DRAFT_462755 [Thelonectria olida]